MKSIFYYISLLIFLGTLSAFLIFRGAGSMTMPQTISLSALFVFYTVLMSFTGEGKAVDERETAHRYLANRIALIGGTVSLAAGLLYQLAYHHEIDLWLLISLAVINLLKIMSLLISEYRK